jgi:hypothetical protein
MTGKIHFPRSPYERLGGYVHLPRLIDKARLYRRGLLQGYNYKVVGFDKHLLRFLGIDGEEFEKIANELDSDEKILEAIRQKGVAHTPEEIEAWSHSMVTARPRTAEAIARFQYTLKEAGGAGRTDIQTYFDAIEFDEGRL